MTIHMNFMKSGWLCYIVTFHILFGQPDVDVEWSLAFAQSILQNEASMKHVIIHHPKPSGKLALLGRAKRWHKLKPSPATRVVCPACVVYLASLKMCRLRCTPWSLCGCKRRAAETPGKGCKGCMAKCHLATTSILVITKTLSPRLKIFGNPWAFMATPLEYAWQAWQITDLRRDVHGNFLIARAVCTGSKATLAPDISPQRNVPWWSPMSIFLPSVIP